MSRITSMTGFASASGSINPGQTAGRSCTLTIKSVNHRHLDLAVRVPAGLEELEAPIRAYIKSLVRRGHAELSLVLEKIPAQPRFELDTTALDAYVQVFREAAQRYELTQEPDLNGFLRMPGVLSAAVPPIDAASIEASVLTLMQELMERFNQARHAEGQALAADLKENIETLLRLTAEARTLREAAGDTELARLQTRLQEVLSGVELSRDGREDRFEDRFEDRLLTEAALLVARGDVDEELVRLSTHLNRFLDLLEGGGEVGRQLDFLLQELHREANTLLSKTGGAASGMRLTEIGLEMKVGLERAREQVQNLE